MFGKSVSSFDKAGLYHMATVPHTTMPSRPCGLHPCLYFNLNIILIIITNTVTVREVYTEPCTRPIYVRDELSYADI